MGDPCVARSGIARVAGHCALGANRMRWHRRTMALQLHRNRIIGYRIIIQKRRREASSQPGVLTAKFDCLQAAIDPSPTISIPASVISPTAPPIDLVTLWRWPLHLQSGDNDVFSSLLRLSTVSVKAIPTSTSQASPTAPRTAGQEQEFAQLQGLGLWWSMTWLGVKRLFGGQ